MEEGDDFIKGTAGKGHRLRFGIREPSLADGALRAGPVRR